MVRTQNVLIPHNGGWYFASWARRPEMPRLLQASTREREWRWAGCYAFCCISFRHAEVEVRIHDEVRIVITKGRSALGCRWQHNLSSLVLVKT